MILYRPVEHHSIIQIEKNTHLRLFELFHPFAIILIHEQNFQRSIPAYFARKTIANAMIKQHFVRAFERGARRDHTPNIGLKTDTCEVSYAPTPSLPRG